MPNEFDTYLAGKQAASPAADAAPAPQPNEFDQYLSAKTGTPAAPTEAPESGHIWGLDTGTRVSHKDIQDIAKQYGVDAPTLEAQSVRLGATYPDATGGEKAMAKLYSTGDTMLGHIPSWLAKQSVAFGNGDQYGEAMDALKDKISGNKSLGQKVTDVATGLATPIGLGEGATAALANASKYAPAAATGALLGGAYGLGDSKYGDSLNDALGGASGAAVAGPALQKTAETGLGVLGKTLGKPADVVRMYLTDKLARARANDPNLTFGSMQDQIDQAAGARVGAESAAQGAVSDAKDTSAAAKQVADQARNRYADALQQQSQVPSHVPNTLDQGLQKQRGVVKDLAQQQQQMLGSVPGKLSLAPIEQRLSSDLGGAQVDGQTMAGDKDAAGIAALQKLMDPLRPTHTPTDVPQGVNSAFHWEAPIPSPEATPAGIARLRQIADDTLHDVYSGPTGAHTDRQARAALGFRGGLNDILDTQLPNSEEYQGLRGALAHESGLATDASKTFGGDNNLPKLQSIFHPNNQGDLATLQELDQRHNLGIMDDLLPMQDAQKQLQNPDLRARAESWLPEVEASQHANEAVGAAKDAQSALLDKHTPYANITPGDGTQAALRKVLFAKANKPELQTQQALEGLGQDYAGTDLLGDAKGLALKEALGRGGPQGSRLVNAGRSVGRAVAGAPGEAVGGIAGLVTDYATGSVVKKAMDTYLAAKDPAIRAVGEQLAPVISGLLSSRDPKAKGYVTALDNAAQRGPQALAVTNAMLQKDPGYKALSDKFAQTYGTNPDASQEPGVEVGSLLPDALAPKGTLTGAAPVPPEFEEAEDGTPVLNYGNPPKKTITQATTGFKPRQGVRVLPDSDNLTTEGIAALLKKLGGAP